MDETRHKKGMKNGMWYNGFQLDNIKDKGS